jgi:hypothetical protein
MRALVIVVLAWSYACLAGAEKGGNSGQAHRSTAAPPGAAGPLNAFAERTVLVKSAAVRELASPPKSAPALEFTALQAGDSAPIRPAEPRAQEVAGLFAPWKLAAGNGEEAPARPHPRTCR